MNEGIESLKTVAGVPVKIDAESGF